MPVNADGGGVSTNVLAAVGPALNLSVGAASFEVSRLIVPLPGSVADGGGPIRLSTVESHICGAAPWNTTLPLPSTALIDPPGPVARLSRVPVTAKLTFASAGLAAAAALCTISTSE